jgi:hypothetical protein
MTPKNALVVAVLTRNSTTSATTNRTAISNDTTGPILSASSYQLATTSGTTTDTYTGAAAQGWTMIMVAFKAATTTVFGGFGTTTATTTLVYDQNGNLLSEGVSTYAWDYKNRLVQSGDGVATSTYGYDQNGTRVKTVEKGYDSLLKANYDLVALQLSELKELAKSWYENIDFSNFDNRKENKRYEEEYVVMKRAGLMSNFFLSSTSNVLPKSL